VFDLGSGCGASAIAAAKSGAIRVTANDVDETAIEAAVGNAESNAIEIETCDKNYLQDPRCVINCIERPTI
jgi:ribosomal protein L11 methylase PrmA